jgi:SAM-dependent methyltransferase
MLSSLQDLLYPLRVIVPKSVRNLFRSQTGGLIKRRTEIDYWRARHREETTLSNDHYEFFYTTPFELTSDDYRGKSILDIGCGPRGSLEWADMAAQRIGLDPLVDSYRTLGIDRHKMTYVRAPVERIPFADAHFDVVTSFNSLDHVDHLVTALSEIRRVVKPGGLWLLIVEANHEPTPAEPIQIDPDSFRKDLEDGFEIQTWKLYDVPADHYFYHVIRSGTPRRDIDPTKPVVIVARMRRKAATRSGRAS